MIHRRFEIALAALFGLLLALWAIFPPGGRPQDLNLDVTVREVQPLAGQRQTVAVTVRWHWLRRPILPLGRWSDGVGFLYDPQRWDLRYSGSAVSNYGQIALRYGEPDAWIAPLVRAGEDGELTVHLVSKSQISQTYRAVTLPLKVQFVHLRNEESAQTRMGWIKPVSADWAIGPAPGQ